MGLVRMKSIENLRTILNETSENTQSMIEWIDLQFEQIRTLIEEHSQELIDMHNHTETELNAFGSDKKPLPLFLLCKPTHRGKGFSIAWARMRSYTATVGHIANRRRTRVTTLSKPNPKVSLRRKFYRATPEVYAQVVAEDPIMYQMSKLLSAMAFTRTRLLRMRDQAKTTSGWPVEPERVLAPILADSKK